MWTSRTSWLGAFLLASLLTATARTEVIDMSVRLDPDCAGTTSSGFGSGWLKLDTDTGIMTYHIDWMVDWPLEYAHIHGPFAFSCGGPPSGPIIHFFTGSSPFVGSTAAFDQATVDGIIAHNYYVNLHTDGWPDGEIRGYIDVAWKNRYITWHPAYVDDARLAPSSSLGMRVTVVSCPPFPSAEGTSLWVGPPSNYPEEDSSSPGRTFRGATLQCDPYLADWSDPQQLQITGGEIVPGSVYRLELYDPTCGDTGNPACYFGARTLETAKFGDLVIPYDVHGLNVQPDFNDISAVVEKFLAASDAPIKAISHLVPNTPQSSQPIDFNTISATVDAFLGVSYADEAGVTGPCTCPSTITCGTACTSNAQCSGGVCFNGECADACGRCTP